MGTSGIWAIMQFSTHWQQQYMKPTEIVRFYQNFVEFHQEMNGNLFSIASPILINTNLRMITCLVPQIKSICFSAPLRSLRLEPCTEFGLLQLFGVTKIWWPNCLSYLNLDRDNRCIYNDDQNNWQEVHLVTFQWLVLFLLCLCSQIQSCRGELLHLMPRLERALGEIQAFQENLRAMQEKRQADVWNLLKQVVSNRAIAPKNTKRSPPLPWKLLVTYYQPKQSCVRSSVYLFLKRKTGVFSGDHTHTALLCAQWLFFVEQTEFICWNVVT